MAIKRRIAALLLTTGLAVTATALSATSAHADPLPWYGCKSTSQTGAATPAGTVAIGGGGCKAFAGAPESGEIVKEFIIVAPFSDDSSRYWIYACKAGVAGIGENAIEGVACTDMDMSAETLRGIVGEEDFNKAFSS
jgi:hypothetical protein